MYKSLEDCLTDLEQNGKLVRVKEEIDPYLEMAALHLRMFEMDGPALLFENIKGSKFRAASNIFGNLERSKFIFRDTLSDVEKVIAIKNDPLKAVKSPVKNLSTLWAASKALPKKKNNSIPVKYQEINISDIPQIQHWPMDGGAFLTLPQVYSEDMNKPGVMHANLGMYRIQLSGNEYIKDKEIGLHYQIHRGIGVHQSIAISKGKPLKVSIFLGGAPAHTLAAVMPLPEGMSEMTFAGLLAGHRFPYTYEDGYCISNEADFVIMGEVYANDTKPEGPFGDHLGYYSLTHNFPVLHVKKVYAKKDAILPFTVVARPPQEDTAFGMLIHELTGKAVQEEIPGVKEVHAVDAAGVHPLLLAIGKERYTPYSNLKQPAEILTQANRILGFGQLSLAKYLFIVAEEDQDINTHNIPVFFDYLLRRVDLKRDLHFQTKTTIDTLDYSGNGLNSGSKVVIAACGVSKRELCTTINNVFSKLKDFSAPRLAIPGVVVLQAAPFQNYATATTEMQSLNTQLNAVEINDVPLIIVVDDSEFATKDFSNLLWVTFTRSNPSHDLYGINSFMDYKHWGCDNLIIDARMKPHHAPPLIKDEAVEKRIDRFFEKGASLEKYKNKQICSH